MNLKPSLFKPFSFKLAQLTPILPYSDKNSLFLDAADH
jgi:hypothetical protein